MSNIDTNDPATGGASQLVTVNQNGVRALNAILQALKAIFPSGTGTSTSATAGSASALPATPAGYVNITLPNGSQAKTPYYNP